MIKYASPDIIVSFVKVLAIATAFQEFTVIVKYCPFTSSYVSRSLYSISYKQRKISLVFRTSVYPKMCARTKFTRRMT